MTLYVTVIMSFTNFKEENMFIRIDENNAKLLNLLGCDNND